MNYERIYNELISNALERNYTKCKTTISLETHHIVPRCIGGTDDSSNLVNLTIREHIIAHLLLAKIHGGKLWYAANAMHMGRPMFKSSKALAIIRENYVKERRLEMKGNLYGSYKWSDARRQTHKDAMRLVGYTKAKQDALKLAWAANKGSKQSKETIAKRSKRMKEIGFTPVRAGEYEVCSKAGKANKGVKKSFRSDEHTKNWETTFKSKYPIWAYEDQIYKIWLDNNKPKVARLRKLATEHNIPEGHLGKMCAKFFAKT